MFQPPQRGMLRGNSLLSRVPVFDRDAPKDYKAHFPGGNKVASPGAALRSQIRAAGGRWTPFTPLSPGFRWRATPCGDDKNGPYPRAHQKGGEYYYGAKIVRKYDVGSVISINAAVLEHHNGFMEFHICNVGPCAGDLTAACFNKRNCRRLKRAYSERCDRGYAKDCAPRDRKNPGRWYIPCNNVRTRMDVYGDAGSMKYNLPRGFKCRRCVLHWFWTAANTCNPKGVVEYFTGPDKPRNWGSCPGQGGAKGGFTAVQKECGEKFPEEYYSCADVSIQ